MSYALLIIIFALGYTAIIFEHVLKINKSAVAIFMAVACWAVFFLGSSHSFSENIEHLNVNVSGVAQIIFFLLGAMAIVELIDSHQGFKVVTDAIHTSSKRKMLWLIAGATFFLSSILDNLTTTILMISLLRKLITDPKDRLLLCCIVVVAANAGGAWTPIGDVTTTMLWINGQLTSLAVIKALFTPSLLSALVPLAYFSFRMKGRIAPAPLEKKGVEEPGARLVFILGVLGLVCVPVFKALTGLPPFMGILISLSILWLVTDGIHHAHEQRRHLRVPYILTKIDISGVLFFLGILLCVGSLEAASVLKDLATWLGNHLQSHAALATYIGLFSAVVDNVPLVAATMGMYPLEIFPPDHPLWHMIAYAAGTGGSILIIGSSSGVALMGMEKIDFMTYMKKVSLPVLVGYLIGMVSYIGLS
ncbi:MAG TPA: sodium:proton antiporter NhaD [Rhabdochlamydiaceae bacterium]|jgi:NhaD family Na+/H+ antiporter|nr:sodium:proton antiporter NhaD [Rhabdochlamydiaceae bacterium]